MDRNMETPRPSVIQRGRELLAALTGSMRDLPDDAIQHIAEKMSFEELLAEVSKATVEGNGLAKESIAVTDGFQKDEEEKARTAADRGRPAPDQGRIEDYAPAKAFAERARNRSYPLSALPILRREVQRRYDADGRPAPLQKLLLERDKLIEAVGAAQLLYEKARDNYRTAKTPNHEAACFTTQEAVVTAGAVLAKHESTIRSDWAYTL